MKYKQEAPDCTWMTNHLLTRNLEFQLGEYLVLVQEFDSNSIEFLTLVYLELD
jgi:hypothetical protein